MRDSDYIFAVGRIRVLERFLLRAADIRSLCALPNKQAVLSALAERGWGSAEQNQSADALLGSESAKLYKLMQELHVDKKIFDLLSCEKYFHNLKCAIKEVCTNTKVSSAYFDLPDFNADMLRQLFVEHKLKDLPSYMRDAAEQAFVALAKQHDAQLCDVILDKACLDTQREFAYSLNNKVMIDYAEAKLLVADIKIALRAARMKKDLKFLQQSLAFCRSIDINRLAECAKLGVKELCDYLMHSGFAGASHAIAQSNTAFEQWCDNYVLEILKPQKYALSTPGPLVAYYLARTSEIRNVNIILTAKEYGFTEEQTLERMRASYV